MAKDPAILFYTQDFLVGTSLLTPIQKGHYITLLCHQQQSATGSLTIDNIKMIMGKDYEKVWFSIMHKFEAEGGGFFNSRMRAEINRRKKFSDEQAKRAKKRWEDKDTHGNAPAHTTAYAENMPIIGNAFLETENEIENKRVPNEGLLGENLSDPDWDSAKNTFLCDGGWIYKFCTAKKVSKEDFEKAANEFLTDLELKQDYKDARGIRSHFTNWFAKYQTNGSHKQSPNGNKPGTSQARVDALSTWGRTGS